MDDVVLVVSELVTNAVLHAKSAPELILSIAGPKLRIEVVDHSNNPPMYTHASVDATHGRGVQLIDSIVDAWGSTESYVPMSASPTGNGSSADTDPEIDIDITDHALTESKAVVGDAGASNGIASTGTGTGTITSDGRSDGKVVWCEFDKA